MIRKGYAFRRMESARDWSASHDGIHSVFVNEESNSMLMSCSLPPKKSLWPSGVDVSPKLYPAYFTEPQYVPSVSLHFVC